ncbi:MAG: tetratricopeptide repeat protein [Acidobacteriota bacterium]
MTPRRVGTVLRVVTCGLAAMVGACAPQDEPAGAARLIALPDVSRLATPVQAQVRERHAVLKAKLEDRATPPAELGDSYGELGLILMAAEYYKAAASCYVSAQALAPDDRRWPYYLGHLYRINGEPDKAAEFFSRALALQPSDSPTLIWLGEMYLDQDRPDQAEPLFLQALSREPSSAAALAGAGRVALAKGERQRAVEYLERALAIDPGALALHYSLAAAYRGLGQLDRANTHLERRGIGRPTPHDPLMEAYEAGLHSPLTLETQGLRALERRQPKQAVDLFRRGLELAPGDPGLLHRLGTALYMAGDTAGAVQQFEQALQRAPGFPRAHFGLGMVFSMSGRHAEAIERFAAAVKSQPDYLEARLGLVEALRVTGRLRESLPHFERIVLLDPGLAEAWVMHAMTLVRLRRYQEARDRLDEARRVHPGEHDLTDLLIRLLAAAPDDRVRDGRRAMALMEELLKEPPRVDVRETMAMTLAELGHYDQAAKWQREAIAAATQAGRADLARLMADNLALYEQRRPCRTPLRESASPALPPSGPTPRS